MANDSKLHSLHLEDLLAHTHKRIGIDGVIWGSTEVAQYSHSRRVVAEIDLLLYTGGRYTHPFHVIEYKASQKRREKAIQQLDRAELFVKTYMNNTCHKWFVWVEENGVYRKEEIRRLY